MTFRWSAHEASWTKARNSENLSELFFFTWIHCRSYLISQLSLHGRITSCKIIISSQFRSSSAGKLPNTLYNLLIRQNMSFDWNLCRSFSTIVAVRLPYPNTRLPGKQIKSWNLASFSSFHLWVKLVCEKTAYSLTGVSCQK